MFVLFKRKLKLKTSRSVQKTNERRFDLHSVNEVPAIRSTWKQIKFKKRLLYRARNNVKVKYFIIFLVINFGGLALGNFS